MVEISKSRLLLALVIISLFGVITFALAAATLGTLNKHYESLKNQIDAVNVATVSTTSSPNLHSTLAQTIRIEDLMAHLNALQRIANQSSDTRAIGTVGFDATVNYIYNYLSNSTLNLTVSQQSVSIQNFSIRGIPTLTLAFNSTTNHSFVYSTELAKSDFTYINYTAAVNETSFNLTVVDNFGCNSSDWKQVAGRAALVKAGGTCTNLKKVNLLMNTMHQLYYFTTTVRQHQI